MRPIVVLSFCVSCLPALSALARDLEPTEVITRVCSGQPGATSCDDPGAKLVWRENAFSDGDFGPNQCVAQFKVPPLPNPRVPAQADNPCYQPTWESPFNATVGLESEMDFLTRDQPGLCCEGVGQPQTLFLDVIVIEGSDEVPKFQGEPNGPRRFIRGGTAGVAKIGNPDVVAHEFAHAYVFLKARALLTIADAEINAGRTRTSQSAALSEGVADALAAAYAAYVKDPRFGQPWKVGDGVEAGEVQRDLTESLTLGFLNAQRLAEDRGRVYGNFFYRLSQQGTFTPEQLFTLAVRTIGGLDDFDKDGFDYKDFLAAVNAAVRNGTAAQKSSVSDVTRAMNPAGLPLPSQPPPPAPPPPAPVTPPAPNGLRRTGDLGCTFDPNNGFISVYRMQWNPTPLARDYDLFSRSAAGNQEYKAKLSGPIADIATNFPTEFTVRACNENGCGPLSPERVPADNSLCAFGF